jgi:hypothetical protein
MMDRDCSPEEEYNKLMLFMKKAQCRLNSIERFGKSLKNKYAASSMPASLGLIIRMVKLLFWRICERRKIDSLARRKVRLFRKYLIVESDARSLEARSYLLQDTSYSKRDLTRIERDIRGAVQHENELLNHRIQWFLTITGFLLTGVVLFGPNLGRESFCLMIGAIGIFVTRSFQIALGIGGKGVKRLSRLWEMYRIKGDGSYMEIGVFGYAASKLENAFAPWRFLPWITYALWISIIIFGLLNPGYPPTGAFSANVVTNKDHRVILHDTRIGKVLNRQNIAPGVIHEIICDQASKHNWIRLLIGFGTRRCDS